MSSISSHGVYAQWFNRRHRRVGHLFQGRYKAVSVQTDAHLRRTVRYVIRNPIRARLSRRPEQWRWTSHDATVGRAAAGVVAVEALLACFADQRAEALRRCEGIVTAHIEHGYSLRQIATHLGCSVTTVHRRVHACDDRERRSSVLATGGTKKT